MSKQIKVFSVIGGILLISGAALSGLSWLLRAVQMTRMSSALNVLFYICLTLCHLLLIGVGVFVILRRERIAAVMCFAAAALLLCPLGIQLKNLISASREGRGGPRPAAVLFTFFFLCFAVLFAIALLQKNKASLPLAIVSASLCFLAFLLFLAGLKFNSVYIFLIFGFVISGGAVLTGIYLKLLAPPPAQVGAYRTVLQQNFYAPAQPGCPPQYQQPQYQQPQNYQPQNYQAPQGYRSPGDQTIGQ